jgi:predicted metal-dependent peptidase
MSSSNAKLAAARFVAAQKAPYFTQALTSLVPREVPDNTLPTKTIAVTKTGILIYEKQFVDRVTVPELAGTLIHETMHIMREHHARMNSTMNPVRWNVAVDMEINDDLKAMGVTLPQGAIYPSTFKLEDGKTAEEYYEALEKQNPDPPPQGGPGDPGCGSGAGNPQDCEDQFTQDPGQRSQADMASIRQQTADEVRSHIAKHGRGSVPNSLSRWAEDMFKPAKIPWSTKLGRIVRGAISSKIGDTDYKYGRPSRRQAGLGYGPGVPMLPSLVSPKPEVYIAVDSSGSMGHEELMDAVSETDAILKTTNSRATFVVCDAAVHASKKIKSAKEIQHLLKGGGGTDFRPMFAEMEKCSPKPNVAIFITDGDGPAPDLPPKGTSVIWVLVGDHRRRPYTIKGDEVAYGDFLEVER